MSTKWKHFLCSPNSKNYMNDKAVIYARVSSVNDRQDTSRQIRDLEILGKEKNLKIIKIFEEHVSGAKKTQDRPVLLECLEYCISEPVKILLLSELSRLGRNVDDVLSNVKFCKEHHLNVYFQKEQLSIFDRNGKEHPFLTIFIAVLGTCAEMERENIKTVNQWDKFADNKDFRNKTVNRIINDYGKTCCKHLNIDMIEHAPIFLNSVEELMNLKRSWCDDIVTPRTNFKYEWF